MTKDMTTGAITPLLIKFTIPLVLGNLFQLTYNAADSIIVGKFVGEDALAAVGTSNPLMTLAILFINGMCLGAGILVSTAFGAGRHPAGGAAGLHHRHCRHGVLFGILAAVRHSGHAPAPAAAGAGRDPAHCCELSAHRVCGPDLHLLL